MLLVWVLVISGLLADLALFRRAPFALARLAFIPLGPPRDVRLPMRAGDVSDDQAYRDGSQHTVRRTITAAAVRRPDGVELLIRDGAVGHEPTVVAVIRAVQKVPDPRTWRRGRALLRALIRLEATPIPRGVRLRAHLCVPWFATALAAVGVVLVGGWTGLPPLFFFAAVMVMALQVAYAIWRGRSWLQEASEHGMDYVGATVAAGE